MRRAVMMRCLSTTGRASDARADICSTTSGVFAGLPIGRPKNKTLRELYYSLFGDEEKLVDGVPHQEDGRHVAKGGAVEAEHHQQHEEQHVHGLPALECQLHSHGRPQLFVETPRGLAGKDNGQRRRSGGFSLTRECKGNPKKSEIARAYTAS